MIGIYKKRHRTIEVADPDFGCAGVEVEDAFFVNLGSRVRWGENLDANFGCAFKKGKLAEVPCARGVKPCDIDSFDTGGGRDRALGHRVTIWEEVTQQSADMYLTLAVERSWRRAHEDVAVLVGLDAIGKFGNLRVREDLGPPLEVESGLGRKVGQLNRNWHRRRYARNAKRHK